jgi:L-2,4-diaminobutyrate decarboxylase
MDREQYQSVVHTFFDCQSSVITEIFGELLAAMEAEQALPPGSCMSQNYETAQANPEIHMLPGNLKDARDAIFPYFWGTDGWSSPLHLENVRGPANYASLIGALACLLKNPNLCTDTYSQRSNELEVKSITALANLVFYYTRDPWGVFTSGGTISNLYAAKIGVEKVLPGAMRDGVQANQLAAIVSEASHYCNKTIVGWLGMGLNSLHAVPVDQRLAMRLDLFEAKLESLYQQGKKVAYVVATFGTTDAFGIDDVESLRHIIDSVSQKYGQTTPQLHVDAAVGWTLCFFGDYDLNKNPLKFSEPLLPWIAQAQKYARSLQYADSITIDVHKMGRAHYPSSAIIVNQRADLKYLSRTVADTPYFCEADSRRDPALFTLECSRPGIGPYCVMASLNSIGLTGWQMLTGRALELAYYLKQRLQSLEYCWVLNPETCGANVVWWVFSKGRNAKKIFEDFQQGKLTPEEVNRYFGEIRRQFDKRERNLDEARDARLSYTTSIGLELNGYDLPAWKAVFFNPKTDEKIIDRLIESLEDL